MKKFAWSGAAVAFAVFVALTMLVGTTRTVSAALPTTVNVIIVDADDTITQPQTTVGAVRVIVDVDDADATGQTDETIVQLVTSIGFWVESGTNTVNVNCAIDGAIIAPEAAPDPGDEAGPVGISEMAFSGEVEVEGAIAAINESSDEATEEGCLGVDATLVIPINAATGTYPITATTSNGQAGVENLLIQAPGGTTPSAIVHTAQSHDSIGFTATGYTPWVNGTVWQVRVTDASGLPVAGRQVQFTASDGVVLVDATTANAFNPTGDSTTGEPGEFAAISEAEVNAACANTTGYSSTVFGTTGTIGTTTTADGRAQVVACGTSAAGNKTATLTATLSGTGLSATDQITVSNEPAQADLAVSISGNTITARLFKGTIPGPDDTAINFIAVPTTDAAFSSMCVELHDGVASTTFAVSAPNAQVLVTAVDDDDGTCGGSVGETWASTTLMLQPVATATPTATATATPACTGRIISGSIPRTGGFGLIVAGCGTIQQIETNTGCPIATMALWATRGGEFIVHVPGTNIGAVNAPFFAVFPGGNIPENEPFVGKCV